MKNPNQKETPRRALVLDVDGSLLKTDMLFECLWAALGRHPWLAIKAVCGLFSNRAALKQRLAELAALDVSLLPVRLEVLALIAPAQAKGREVILASGSDKSLVDALSQQLNLKSAPLASDGVINLTGARKAASLTARYGRDFEYVGDSRADIPVWQAAAGGYVVAPDSGLKKRLSKAGLSVESLSGPSSVKSLLRAMRPHQWVKNILLLLPILAAHRSDMLGVMLTLWGIAIFSAAASSIYIVNDLMDLSADRKHPAKRFRPFAAGEASIGAGMVLSLGLAMIALGGAALLSWSLFGIIALYMALSLSYSLGLKRLRWVDIAMLASLYTLRVVAGSVAAGVAMSGWLGAFVFPVFLALGGVKRLIELGKTTGEAQLPGRGYARRDRADLRNISITAAIGAVVVYTLYTYSEIAQSLYASPWEIRLAALPVALWLGRMILLGWRGRMNYDPIVFALRDPVGLALMAVGGGLLIHAAG